MGRLWKTYTWDVFGIAQLEYYCLILPQGKMCMAAMSQDKKASTTEAIRNNFVSYTLSEFYMSPLFWRPQALTAYLSTKEGNSLQALRDVDLTMTEETAAITLKSLGLAFEITKPELIRFHAARYPREKANSNWVAMQFDVLVPDEKYKKETKAELDRLSKYDSPLRSKFKLCQVIVEMKDKPISRLNKSLSEKNSYYLGVDKKRSDFVSPHQWCGLTKSCLLYTSPSPRDATLSRMPSSA